MTTLAIDAPRSYELGDVNEFPVIASDIIYEGAAVGLVNASGHARPLTSVDRFVGFAEKIADNSAGAAAAKNVRVKKRGCVELAISGAVITDINLPVYASDDNTFSFLKTGGVFVGFSRRFVSSGYMIVEFDADAFIDPHDGLVAETLSASTLTLDGQDNGKVIFVTADSTITLPAIAQGIVCRIVNAGPFGTVVVNISPNSSDGIFSTNLTNTDDKDLINTKATACRGDQADLYPIDATGWGAAIKGTWVKES
jgi:hypothetical protein